jgi:hypothetical protein
VLGEEPMSDNVLWKEREEVLQRFPLFTNNAPLWFYILREAERTRRNGCEDDPEGGHHLGPVGGRIVAEVLVGLTYYDAHSFLRQTSQWRPHPEVARQDGTFDMARLIEFTDQYSC